MKLIPNAKYSKEFRIEAVRLVTEQGLSAGEAANRLMIPKTTLENWVRAFKAGKLEKVGASQKPFTEIEIEFARVKKENAILRMEIEILKKAAAYFAKESLQGTR
jgi:transposase